jgi:hypothetical protein
MKSLRLGLIALAALAGVGSAFASNHNAKVRGTEYAVIGTDGSNYIVSTNTSGKCNAAPSDVCLISSSTPPTDNEIPMSDATVLKNGLYQE